MFFSEFRDQTFECAAVNRQAVEGLFGQPVGSVIGFLVSTSLMGGHYFRPDR